MFAACAIYLLLCLILFLGQRSFLYFPQPRTNLASTLVLQKREVSILITTQPFPGSQALIYFGGNAEDVSLSLIPLAAAFPKHALYLPHYRGYGGSGGNPSEEALFADALALFDRIHSEHEYITVIGRSLGSGIATYLASQRPVAKLVLVTPYNSIQELAARKLPYFPVHWLLQDKFESWRYAPKVTAPTLMLVAEQDTLVPRASSNRLYEHFPSGIAVQVILPGTTHHNISRHADYYRWLQSACLIDIMSA